MFVVAAFSIYLFSAEVATLATFDPETGELVKGENCKQYRTQINEKIDIMNAEQSDPNDTEEVGSETEAIKELWIQGMKEGCPPEPRWGKAGGKRTPIRPTNEQQHAYVPASEGESLAWDFSIGNFGFDIGYLLNSIFPQINKAIQQGKGYVDQGQQYNQQGQAAAEQVQNLGGGGGTP